MKGRFLTGLMLLSFVLVNISGQVDELRFHHIDVDDGLSHSLVSAMAEDSLGFMWIGTQDGLNRYDGYGFKTYFLGSNNRSPSDNWISDLFVDRHNQIWIVYSGKGIDRFDPFTETFHAYESNPLDSFSIPSTSFPSSAGNKVRYFLEDSKGQLWIGTSEGLCRYRRETDDFQVFSHNPDKVQSLSSNRIRLLIEGNDEQLWIGCSDGLNQLNIASGEIRRCNFGEKQGLDMSAHAFTTGFLHPDGSLWLGTDDQGIMVVKNPDDPESEVINLLDKALDPNFLPNISDMILTSKGDIFANADQGFYRIYAEDDDYSISLEEITRGRGFTQLLEDSKGNVWTCSNQQSERSLIRISADRTETEIIKRARNIPYMFGGIQVLGIMESSKELLWIATEKSGIYRVDLNARRFRTIDDNPDKKLYLTNREVYSIYEDENRQLYVGTKEELNRIDLDAGTTYGFNNNYGLKRWLSYEYSDQLPARLIGVLTPDREGQIWMGAFDYKLSRYDPERQRFLNFHLNEDDSTSFLLWSLRSICVTRKGDVYVGSTSTGLVQLRPDGHSFRYFPVVETGDPRGTNDGHIQYIYEDRSGILWIGTINGGLNRLDPETGVFTHLVHEPDKPGSLSINRVKCILEPEIGDQEGLWIGTQGGGLNRYDRKTGTFTSISIEDGLPSNSIHGILEDKEGRLWISTNRGLVQMDPLTGMIWKYTSDDGLAGDEFNEGAFFKNNDGIMYFGGTRGITYFDPAEIKEKPEFNAPVVFTGFNISGQRVLPGDTVNNRVILDQSISFTSELRLTYRERFLSFEFASLDMASAQKLKYRYILEKFEEEWNEVGADQRIISYSNIPAGSYSLKVMGSNSDGTLFMEPTVLELEILPPFWNTTWFRFMLMLIVIFAFVSILQVRTRILKKQKEHLAREVEERTHDLKQANNLLEDRNVEIQEMAEKLHESDQMKLKFFTNISHEFRTPLTLIMGPTEKLLGREEIKNSARIREELELIYRNERRLFKLINQLLEVRRVETGNLVLAVAEDDLLLYLKVIYQLFGPYAEKKKIDFRFESNVGSLNVLFDADKVEKIFYNLLSNAFKHTPVGGQVIFRCDKIRDKSEEWVRVEVEDSGPGLHAEHLQHIFDRFYQVTEKHQSARISSGIGLSLSRDLTENHHGRIEVESEPGRGTTLRVFLPVSREFYAENEILIDVEKDFNMEYIPSMLESYEFVEEIHRDSPLVGEEVFRILVVEDNPDLQKFLYNEMSDIYDVQVAMNGLEALEFIEKNLPDLVISDIMMPEMDGLELCRRIKESENSSHIPVLLLTAKSEMQDQAAGLETGAEDYITKPFRPELLKLKVRNILEARKQLADKFSSTANYIPENIKISQIDQGFLEKFIKLVEDNLDDTGLSGDRLAGELGMSKGNLYKKLKSLTGMTVNIYIRTIRLKVAARLLKKGKYNISEVAYAVGFNNPKYFSTCFSEMFRMSPKEYMK